MVLFMFGLIVTVALFIAMGFVRGTKVVWKLNVKQLAAAIGVVIIAISCYVSVPTGHTGVVTTFVSVEDDSIRAGIHVTNPWQ